MSEKRVYLFREGNANMRNELGGKGANLAEMTNLGLPVPPGLTITTATCMDYINNGNKMPENKEYEIYYKNNCGLLVKTGVTVSYTKEEIQIETGSSYYISMTPMLIGGLLLMLL